MKNNQPHTFHIPVMGLAFTIDSPVKVAKYGISSVVSIIEDELIERMREIICKLNKREYQKIDTLIFDYRTKRITSYLNLIHEIVAEQQNEMRLQNFETGTDLVKYFELLPEDSELKQVYLKMCQVDGLIKIELQKTLKESIVPGSIDVNIMTKIDKINYDKDGNELDATFSDASSALRAYANSQLESSVVFSAGLNPRLYAYCEKFDDFFPDHEGNLKKKIILKVSDYRSAFIQGKYLAKKGLWVSEFRVESGINCGGHAFVSDGTLIGPILEEFKNKRKDLHEELYRECSVALAKKERNVFKNLPELKVTAQGGIGTSFENSFLQEYYNLNTTGWGSPFLLVPEATTLDEGTLQQLSTAKQEDYYLSHSSPLGVPFNNFKGSSSEHLKLTRIEKNRPGSPCYKKFLILNKEYTDKPICTASREYQKQKIEELQNQYKGDEIALIIEVEKVIEKECLCEGLGASALLLNKAKLSHNLSAVSICPGPNLAYFSGTFTLKQMVDHIYGRVNLLNPLNRPMLFLNELQLYINYLVKDIKNNLKDLSVKKMEYYVSFKYNLMTGINYYELLFSKMKSLDEVFLNNNLSLLDKLKQELNQIEFSKPAVII